MAIRRPTHALVPDRHRDPIGRRWCITCRLPEDNAVHELAPVIDLAKARFEREERERELNEHDRDCDCETA